MHGIHLANNIGFNSLECRRTCNIQLAKFHQMAECARKCCSTIVLDVVLCHTRLRETTKARGGLNCRHRTYATNKALAVLSHAPTAWQVPWLLQHQGCSLTLEKPRKDGCYRPGCPTTPTERRVPGMSNSRSAAICATHFIMDVHPSGPMLVAAQPDVRPRCCSVVGVGILRTTQPQSPQRYYRRQVLAQLRCTVAPKQVACMDTRSHVTAAMHSVHRCTHSSDPSPAGGRVL